MAKQQSVQWQRGEWLFASTTDKRRALSDCTSPNQRQHQQQRQLLLKHQQQQRNKQQFKQLAPQDAIPQAATATTTTNRRTFQARLGWLMFLVAASLMLLASSNSGGSALVSAMAEESSPRQQQSAADTKAALEAELNSILQQQKEGVPNSKLLSEAIISRLMLGNLSDIGALDGADSQAESLQLSGNNEEAETNGAGVYEAAYSGGGGGGNSAISPLEAQRLRRILSYLQNYEMGQQYPVLPLDQAATIKRASIKMGNYLRQQSQHQHGGQRQLSGYGRVNSFDFGLGKRPDSSAGAANILRFGDSAPSSGSHLATVSGSGLGKRPSAHRYDFGLGKRVASPAYPRYDFGLGKRAPGSRLRYDFGLGK